MKTKAPTKTHATLSTTHLATAALGCPVEQRSTWFRHVLQLLLATVREIFDESAYQRFLTHHHLNSSRRSYALFLEDQETRKVRQPKCC
jgi:hypothetical protein